MEGISFHNVTIESAKRIALKLSKMANSSGLSKTKDQVCYRYYNGLYRKSDFNYLTKIGDNDLPARIKFIPIVKQRINRLKSQYLSSGLKFKVFVSDEEALDKKYNKKIEEVVNLIEQNVDDALVDIGTTEEMIQQQQQQIQQATQQQAKTKEDQDRLEKAKQAIPMLMGEYKKVFNRLDSKKILLQEDLENIEDKYKIGATELAEIIGQKLLEKAIDVRNIKEQLVNGFTNKMITGKPLFYVHHEPGNKYPKFKSLQSTSVSWSADEDVSWIQKTRWASISYNVTPTQLIDDFKFELKANSELFNKIIKESSIPTTSGDFIAKKDGGATADVSSIMDSQNSYSGTKTNTAYTLTKLFFKGSRNVNIKKIPNPYKEGDYLRHFIEDVDNDKWYRSKEKNLAKGEKMSNYPVNDLWEAYILNDSYVIKVKKSDIQLRDEDYNIELPILGPSFNEGTEAPYSLIWTTKDTQDLYNIISYHKELMLAISGTKGTIMDDDQRPAGMSRKEWSYYKKLGSLYLSSTKRTKSGRRPTFGQWGATYDETVSPAIQYLDNMLVSLDNVVASLTGVSRESMGMTIASDQVGTYEMSVQNSSLIVQHLFWEYDQLTKHALTRYMNLLRITQKSGKLSLVNQKLENEIINIPKNVFKDRKFDLYVKDTLEEYKGIQQLRQVASNAWGKGTLPMSEFTQIMDINNLGELQNKLEYFSAKAEKLRSQAIQAEKEGEKNFEMEKIKFEKEFEKFFKSQEFDLKNKELQLKAEELKLKQLEIQNNLKTKDKELNIKGADVESERAVEAAMLKEQERSAKVNEQLKAIELKLNTIMKEKDISVKEKSGNKDNAGNKKNHVNNN